MRIVKQIDLFVSSPGEMNPERRLLERVCDNLNRDLGLEYEFNIRTLDWTRDVRPQVGASGQDVINSEIGKAYDIYVGFLGTYFGSKTESYRSGTEQEFHEAYARHKSSGLPEILFYFAKRDVPLQSIDPEHIKLLNGFRETVESLGVFYSYFIDDIDLSLRLQRDIGKAVRSILNRHSGEKTETLNATSFTSSPISLANYEALLESNPLARASHLMKKATDEMALVAKDLDGCNAELRKMARDLNKHVKSLLNELKYNRIENAHRAIQSIEGAAERVNGIFILSIPSLHDHTLNSLELLQRAIAVLRLSGVDVSVELRALKPHIFDFQRSFSGWEDPISNLIAEIESLQRNEACVPSFEVLKALSTDLLYFGRRVSIVVDDLFIYLDEMLGPNWEKEGVI